MNDEDKPKGQLIDELKERAGVLLSWKHPKPCTSNFRVPIQDDEQIEIDPSTCLGSFVAAGLRLCFYLNDDFAPFWKGRAHEARKIGWAQPILEELDGLATTRDKLFQDHHPGGWQSDAGAFRSSGPCGLPEG